MAAVPQKATRHIKTTIESSEFRPTSLQRSTVVETAAKLLAPEFVESYERLAQACIQIDRTSPDDHEALRRTTTLTHLQVYMSLQPFKGGSCGFSNAFDTSIIPRLVGALSSYLDQRLVCGDAVPDGCSNMVTTSLAEECLFCLVNMSACNGQMVKLLLRHGVVSCVNRLLLSRVHVPQSLLQNAAWVIGNLAGDSILSRDQVLGEHALWALLGRSAIELRSLGYFPFNSLSPSHAPSQLNLNTSSLLKICSWAMSNACEGRIRPPCPLEFMLPVVSALMDVPDTEVQVSLSLFRASSLPNHSAPPPSDVVPHMLDPCSYL
jgi:hypothetical protein